MTLKWLGHACFQLVTREGLSIVTDPFDASVGYRQPHVVADLVTVSHGHHDHDCMDALTGPRQRIDRAGLTEARGVRFVGIPSFHDGELGARRGENLMFLIEADGLRIAHLGDLGHALSEQQAAQLTGLDVLLIPVGGFYTIDARQAAGCVRRLKPRLTVPMHYLTPATQFPISGVQPFLDEMGGGRRLAGNSLELDERAFEGAPEVLVLEYE